MADAQQNPFAEIEANATAQNPFAQLEGADPGAMSDLVHGVKRGFNDVPKMAAQTGQFIGHAVHAAGAAIDSDSFESLGDTITQHMAQSAQTLQGNEGASNAQSAPGEEGGIIRRNVYGTGEMLGQMGTAVATGAAAGALAGSVVPGAGTLAGAVVGGSIALLGALPALFGGSTAETTFEKVQKVATDNGMAPQEAENRALGAGAVTGAIAGGGQFALQKIGLGKALEPVIAKVGAAAEGMIVKTALSQTFGNAAKGVAVAAGEGAAVNAATQAGIEGTEAGYGAGEGPTAKGLIDSAVQGGVAGGLLHGVAGTAQAIKVGGNVKLMADPQADPNARANAALGAAAIISTKSPDVGRDFALYAQQQIIRGQPIDVGPDSMYTGFADAIRQQKADAQTAADQAASRTTLGDFPGFTPTGDEAAALAPDHVTDPNVQSPTPQPASPVDVTGRTSASQFPSFTPTGDELAAASRTVPQTAPPSITETIGSIMHAGSVDEAIHAAEQSIAGGAAAGIEHAQNMLHAAGVSRAAAVESVPAPDALQTDRAFYEEQAQRAQQDMRTQAFDQTQANITPPVPDHAFAQRQADLTAEETAKREQGFQTAEADQRELQANQAPAVTEAQGFNEPAKQSALSGAMGAELTRLGNRNLNNLTTTQLGALSAHHPDEMIRQQAAQIAAGRRNAALVAENPAGGADLRAAAAPVEPGFSAERANPPADGLPVARTTEATPDYTPAAPVGAPARSFADTAPQLQPLKAAMDADARARGQKSAPGLAPVDMASLPDTRTPVENGVEGATTLSKADAGLLQKTAAIFGKRVELFRQEGETGGHSTEGAVLPGDAKTIYVNADAAGAHHLVIVGHELAHQMQAESPRLYKGMQDALLAHAGEGSQHDFMRYYMNRPDMTPEQARQSLSDPGVRQRMTDEFIADLVGNRFGEYRTWQQVFADAAGSKDRSLVYRIADYITSFIDRLLAGAGFKKFATDDMVKNLTDVRTQVRRALSEYATQAGTKPMQHEAEMLRAKRDNKAEGPKLVEPVKAEPRADVGVAPDKAAPAPVAERAAEPAQGSQRIEPVGTPRTERAVESPERAVSDPVEATNKRYPIASDTVDGRKVMDDVPNQSSIEASLGEHEVLSGIRDVPFSAFDQMGELSFHSKSERERTENLAERMKQSKEIAPLIVVEDKEGPYVLEGGHRFDALRLLGAKSFPAKVVVDMDSMAERTGDEAVHNHASSVNISLTPERSNERQGISGTEGSSGGKPEAVSAGSAAADSVSRSGVIRGSAEWLAKQSRAHQGDDLSGLPSKVTVPGVGAVEFHSFKPAQDAARSYAEEHGIEYQPPKAYVKVDPERASRIAQEFEAMQHDPQNPEVAAAYDALIHETAQQYEAAIKAGLKVEFIKPGQEDPYAMSPRLAVLDAVNNNHMWVYSTREGFGSSEFDPASNPLLRETTYEISGQKALANDLFRVVHDYFGHVKDGVGFRADGEENAWRSHMAMYSDLARRAATTETRGQNSWVNYGPYAEANKTASGADTHYADQKIGLLPEWVSEEGRGDEASSTRLGAEPDAAKANPFSTDPQVRASGERALFLGKLDTAQEAAARSIGAIVPKKTVKQSIDELKQDLGKKLQQGIADQFAPIRYVDEKAYQLARMSKGTDGALEALMMYGKPFLRDGVYDVDVKGKGFAKVMADLDGEHGRFFLWVAAQRAENLKAEDAKRLSQINTLRQNATSNSQAARAAEKKGDLKQAKALDSKAEDERKQANDLAKTGSRENLFTDTDISALKTLNTNDAQHPMRQSKFDQALKDYNSFNDAVLKIAEDSGLLDPETRQLFKDQPYVPFYRAMGEGEGMKGPGKTAGLVNMYAFKKLKGGSQQLNQDLLANTLQNWSHLLAASASNRAAKATMDAAEKLGVADQVPASLAGKGTVKVMDQGKAVHYEVNDPHLLSAISAMSQQVPGWMKPLTTFKRLLTAGVTIAPGFKIRNLIRDTVSSIAIGDISANPVKNIAQGFKATAHDSQTYASMLASGGIIRMGSMLDGNEAERAHRLIESGVDKATILNSEGAVKVLFDKAKDVFEAYQELGDRSENINRAALYEQLVAKGYDHADASFMSRDLMDFSMQGNWPVIRFLTQSVPFLNARIQGLYKLGRASVEHPGRVGAVLGAVSLASLGLLLMNHDDPDWKAREDWDRDSYWWFKIGKTAFRIPKPFEVGAVGTIAERTWELFTDREMTGSRYTGRIADIIGQQFSMNPTPQIIKPFMDVYANKDGFTGRPIEGMAMQKLQAPDRYSPSTTMTARLLGSLGLPDPTQLINGHYSPLSPVQMDSLLKGYFGWTGMMALGAVDAIVRPMTGEGARPARTLADYTLGFADDLPSSQSRYVTQMYKNLTDIEQAYNSYHTALKTGQFDKARQEMADNRALITSYSMAESVKRTESTLALQEKRIQNSETLSADTKRTMLNRVAQQRAKLAEQITAAEQRRMQ